MIMNEIRKTINLDNSRSHRNGLLPFVRYGGNGTIEEIKGINSNGNYGGYVCDFCIYDSETNKEIRRLKYIDVLSKYYFIQESFKNAAFVKKYNITDTTLVKIDCKNTEESKTYETETHIKWGENFDEFSEKRKYDYIPLDKSFFSLKDTYYEFEVPFEYVLAKNKQNNEEVLTTEEDFLIKKVEYHKNVVNENEYIVLLPNYDEINNIEDWWREWWLKSFNEGWEKDIFDGYDVSNNVLKFSETVETYMLGQIEVVGLKTNGSRVPSYVYYTNLETSKKWFESNSAATINAYNNTTEENKWIIEQWEEKGGGEFYDFLRNITPKWQTIKTVFQIDKNIQFKYAPPIMTIDIMVNSDEDYETLYNTYEYSIESGKMVGVVEPYKPMSIEDIKYVDYAFNEDKGLIERTNCYFLKNTIGTHIIDDVEYVKITSSSTVCNGLTKQWLDCADSDSYCESKLTTLKHPRTIMVSNDIFGVYKNFDDEIERGQMFECKFCSGTSIEPKIEVYYSGMTIFNELLQADNGETCSFTPTTLLETIDEVYPKPYTESGKFQIIGTKVIDSNTTIESAYSITNENELIEEKYYWSSITQNVYTWWECKQIDNGVLKCADGEYVLKNEKKYRNVVITSCVDSLVGGCDVGDVFYVMARYNNGNFNPADICSEGTIHSLGIPYICDYPLNIISYDDGTIAYDSVLAMEEDEGIITIKYGKGLTSGASQNTGVHYEETLLYKKNQKANIPIDGAYLGEIYYDVLGGGSEIKTVYSEEYKKYRDAQIAKIIGIEVGTTWTENGAVSALLFTKDGYEGLQEEPKYDINLLYNRGNAAAWEKHFKLSECNTMEDLENYGNNFFNL